MLVIALLAMALGFWLATSSHNDDSEPGKLVSIKGATVFPKPRALPEFTLHDQHEAVFDNGRLKGRWSFVFFGYTFCPDVCPTTLSMLARVHELLAASPAGVKDVQFVLVSVDPQRDTPGVLDRYVTYFNKDFVGVSGETAQLDVITRAFGAVYLKVPGDNENDYIVDHSAHVFVVNPQGQEVAILPPPHKAETVAKAFSVIREM